jgi:hypothetical protein
MIVRSACKTQRAWKKKTYYLTISTYRRSVNCPISMKIVTEESQGESEADATNQKVKTSRDMVSTRKEGQQMRFL